MRVEPTKAPPRTVGGGGGVGAGIPSMPPTAIVLLTGALPKEGLGFRV